MFDVSYWLNDLVEASCGKKGCKADIILPCDNLEEAEARKAIEDAEELVY